MDKEEIPRLYIHREEVVEAIRDLSNIIRINQERNTDIEDLCHIIRINQERNMDKRKYLDSIYMWILLDQRAINESDKYLAGLVSEAQTIHLPIIQYIQILLLIVS